MSSIVDIYRQLARLPVVSSARIHNINKNGPEVSVSVSILVEIYLHNLVRS